MIWGEVLVKRRSCARVLRPRRAKCFLGIKRKLEKLECRLQKSTRTGPYWALVATLGILAQWKVTSLL